MLPLHNFARPILSSHHSWIGHYMTGSLTSILHIGNPQPQYTVSGLAFHNTEADNTSHSVSQSGTPCSISSHNVPRCFSALCINAHHPYTCIKKCCPSDHIAWGAMTKVGVVGAEPIV